MLQNSKNLELYNHAIYQTKSQYKENKQLDFYTPAESLFFQPSFTGLLLE